MDAKESRRPDELPLHHVGAPLRARLRRGDAPFHERVEALHEEMALAREVRVEHRWADAQFPDEGIDPGTAVAFVHEVLRGQLDNGAVGALVFLLHQVDVVLFQVGETLLKGRLDLAQRERLPLELADTVEQVHVLLGIEGSGGPGFLESRKEPASHVEVDGAPGYPGDTLEFGYGQHLVHVVSRQW